MKTIIFIKEAGKEDYTKVAEVELPYEPFYILHDDVRYMVENVTFSTSMNAYIIHAS